MMTVKEELYKQCKMFLDARLETVLSRIANIQESLQSETKSSAGDKHETGRAMLQLEREKAGNQLVEIQKQQEQFSKVTIDGQADVACLGSIVITDKGAYFLAISVGAITINEKSTIGAGSVITKNVKKNSLALTRSSQSEVKNYKRKK